LYSIHLKELPESFILEERFADHVLKSRSGFNCVQLSVLDEILVSFLYTCDPRYEHIHSGIDRRTPSPSAILASPTCDTDLVEDAVFATDHWSSGITAARSTLTSADTDHSRLDKSPMPTVLALFFVQRRMLKLLQDILVGCAFSLTPSCDVAIIVSIEVANLVFWQTDFTDVTVEPDWSLETYECYIVR